MELSPHSFFENKQIKWQREKEAVDLIVDKLGKGIDEGIKEAVIALCLLGINTTNSHEGKIHRYPIPHIDIASSEAEKLSDELELKYQELKPQEQIETEKQISSLYDQLEILEDTESQEAQSIYKKIKVLDAKIDEFPPLTSPEIKELETKIEQENLKEQEKILDLLRQFYATRNIPSELKLHILQRARGQSRLQSMGAENQKKETDEQKRLDMLKQFQSEMSIFTDFLKKIFFEVQ